MTIPIVRAALLSFALFTAGLALMQGGRSAVFPLQQLFTEDCPAGDIRPCFMGIVVGNTSLVEARDLLAAHGWVVDIEARMTMDYFGIEHLRFRWTDPNLPADANVWQGELSASYNVVQRIRLEAPLTLGEVWYALGEPPIVAYSGMPSRRNPVVLLYNTFSEQHSVRLISVVSCPLSARNVLYGAVMALELREREDASAAQPVIASPLTLLQALRNSRPMC